MIITPQILTIPPYLSTTWKNISSLHAVPNGEKFKLVVLLHNKMRIVVPDLDKASLDELFVAHARFGSAQETSPFLGQPMGAISLPLGGKNGIDLLNAASQHNPDQANAPELPAEILEKITQIAKVLGLDESSQLPKAEPHCNCSFCQIARALHQDPMMEGKIEEAVTEEDLTFRNWEIKQTAEKLYTVSNPLDANEHYSVYLGDPLGCTCGQKNCEHLRAVLSS
jgi:hypothetical protein